jgi:outer membrane protein assembly factor BamE (lipoprotein component of BamABCDE complex)
MSGPAVRELEGLLTCCFFVALLAGVVVLIVWALSRGNTEPWKQLKPGMTADEVRALLGPPTSIHAVGNMQTWYYGRVFRGRCEFQADVLCGYKKP